MQQKKEVGFWQKNQVLIMSILSALTLVIQQAWETMQNGEPTDWAALGIAALIVVGGVIGKELRGKGFSIAGILGVMGAAFEQVATSGEITLERMILPVILGIIALATPPFKSIGYEYTDIIKEAKIEGEADVPTPVASAKIKEKAEEYNAKHPNS